MGLSFVLILIGLALLAAGAEGLVRGGVGLARRARISSLVVGLTVVAFGTSAPEMAVSVRSALGGQGGLAVGNIVGSSIFNVFTILGLGALILPLDIHRQVIRREMGIMIAVSLLGTWFFLSEGGLARWEGAVLFAGVLLYTVLSARAEKQEEHLSLAALSKEAAPEPPSAEKQAPLWLDLGMVLAGLALLVCGAQALVTGAVAVARAFGISEAVIGLTVVAMGTSLPELATTLVAALRRHSDIAVGNAVGSNIFNILSIGGATGLIAPVEVKGVGWLDYGFMLGAALLLLVFMATGRRISRWEGAVLLGCQGLYVALLWPK